MTQQNPEEAGKLPPAASQVSWQEEFGAAITVIDRDFIIRSMNDASAAVNAKWGGAALVGKDVRDCHREASILIMERILQTGEPNTYTIEKQGLRKLIHQAPWRLDGEIMGLVELSIVLPDEMPHHVRG